MRSGDNHVGGGACGNQTCEAGETDASCPADCSNGNSDGPSQPEKPVSLPALADLRLYSADSPLNQRIPADAEIDPDSDNYVALIAEAAASDGFVIEFKQYSAPVYFADSSTPRWDVYLACGQDYANVDFLKDVPIPDFAEPANDIDGADNPIPFGVCGDEADQDNQMIILNLETRCEYDFFQARLEDGRWVASWANSISLDSAGIYEKGFSARGSGFTTLAGLIWPDELENGQINHALGFTYPGVAAGGPVAPATESDGVSTGRWALPEGARLRLDPTLDLDTLGLTPYEKTIANALQEYGMILFDDGSSAVSVEAIDPRSTIGNPYEGLFPDVDFPELDNIPLDRLQLLKLPPQNPNADDT
ncbi:MAG: hypothetical protein ACE5GE_16005, partial [Phycisphaerae bacterium]